ncbi:outer membrane protein assembly factor BamB family protein [Kitasatospora purpeofusca]|uniref:outer membrane protein assembly factor BamB family protein n=1 Tax=Kitasatospora purpeofusca TaxID=67352 RepID=UPI00225703EF|nr:PQQ-binding-like beta-propeller repeat protein [Kitasatospora purpeofusca]MCX4756055.1 PQQ-like beta-propeller repeat protein [Kitasatospora purpeofusca]WSR36103.1 PQQ-like beta-propeller repeat protein [Kitasatospora purpeofusca]
MGSTPADRSAGEASWRWDGEDEGGTTAPADVVSGGEDGGGGPRPSRRRLLIGAGVLAAGAAVWGVSRRMSAAPTEKLQPRPLPSKLVGPEPLWVYQGPEPMTPNRLNGRLFAPAYVTAKGVRILDPASGAVVGTVEEPALRGRPEDSPLIVGAGRLFTTSTGHVDARALTGPAAGWSQPLPPELGERISLFGSDGAQVYGTVESRTDTRGTLFAVDVTGNGLLWSRPFADRGENAVTVLPIGGRLLTWGADPEAGMSLVDGTTGRRLWTTPGTAPAWSMMDQRHVYLPPPGATGVQALRMEDGAPRWSVRPGPGEEWRALPPLSDGYRVYVPRDNGLITAHEAGSGEQTWQCQLPFRLDRRCRPLLLSSALLVPGPAAAGVVAVEAEKGALSTIFSDTGPGVDVWSVASDGTRLYAGHDSTLYCLGELPVP